MNCITILKLFFYVVLSITYIITYIIIFSLFSARANWQVSDAECKVYVCPLLANTSCSTSHSNVVTKHASPDVRLGARKLLSTYLAGIFYVQSVSHTICFYSNSFSFWLHRGQMAHPLHQDPEPSEAKRRREGLTQQAVQGKCLIYFQFIPP